MTLSYSIQEVCSITGIGQTKIYEAINQRLLLAKKYGRRTIILKEDLDDFLNNLPDMKQKQSSP